MNKDNKKTNENRLLKIVVKRLNKQTEEKFKLRKILISFTMAFFIIFAFSTIYGATDPTLVTKVNSALKKIQGYLVKIATPAAGIAIASGVLMRKFSFGNEEKMAVGKKVIVNAIVGYAIVLSIDLIIKFVDALI